MIRRIALCFCLAVVTAVPVPADGIKAKLVITPSRALVGIPPDFDIILTNTSSSTLPVPKYIYFRVHYLPENEWFVVDSSSSDGRVFRFPLIQADFPKEIRAAETLSHPVYATPERVLDDHIGGRNYLKPGTYMIEALLSDRKDHPVRYRWQADSAEVALALRTPVASSSVEFTVLEPEGIDASMWSRIAAVSENGEKNIIGSQSIRDAIDEYPESAYVPYYSGYYGLPPGKSLEFAERMLARQLPTGLVEHMRLRKAFALYQLADVARGTGRNAEFKTLWRSAFAIYSDLAANGRTVRGKAQKFISDFAEVNETVENDVVDE